MIPVATHASAVLSLADVFDAVLAQNWTTNMPEVPSQAVQITWTGPVEAGIGLRAEYPIVSRAQQYALFHEVRRDWAEGLMAGGWQFYAGDVWSIQLTARPGYYVEPDYLYYLAQSDADVPPFG